MKNRVYALWFLAFCGFTALCVCLTHLNQLLAATDASCRNVMTVAAYPHDAEAFTQGLLWHDGALYEGTGLYGSSALRRVELESGKAQAETRLAADFFGEGIALHDGKLYQLTWKRGVAYVYDAQTLERTGVQSYSGQGWGLASNGTHLIQSNGSDTLTVRRPQNFEAVREVRVCDGEKRIRLLNELEWVDGMLYANVWRENHIAAIDIKTGQVRYWLDISAIAQREAALGGGVPNGIAWDAKGERLFITGKRWAYVYHIRIEDN